MGFVCLVLQGKQYQNNTKSVILILPPWCYFFLSKPSEFGRCYLHFREENNQAKRHQIICPRLHSMSIAKLRFKPIQPDSEVQVINPCLTPTLKRKEDTAFLPMWGFTLIPGAARAQKKHMADLTTCQIRQSLLTTRRILLNWKYSTNMWETKQKFRTESYMPCSNMSLVANTESRKFTCIGFYSVPVGSVGSVPISVRGLWALWQRDHHAQRTTMGSNGHI